MEPLRRHAAVLTALHANLHRLPHAQDGPPWRADGAAGDRSLVCGQPQLELRRVVASRQVMLRARRADVSCW